MTNTNRLLQFWAKKKENPEVYYPLMYHMLDVAAVTREMWDSSLHGGTRHYCAAQLKISKKGSLK